jgi:hypothetical protein
VAKGPRFIPHSHVVVDPRGLPHVAAHHRVIVDEVWVESPLGEEWVAAFRLFEQEGNLAIGELRIFPATDEKDRLPGRWPAEIEGLAATRVVPRGGLTARLVRTARFDDVNTFIRSALDELRRRGFALEPWKGVVAAAPPAPKRAGRRGLPDVEYAKVAAAYVARIGQRNPVEEVAREMHYSHQRIREMLRTARRRGLLTDPPRRGRAGGDLTDRARRLLREEGASDG